MKHLTNALKAMPLCILLLSAMAVKAQDQPRIFRDSTGRTAYILERNEVISIQCDTVYLLNKPTFRIYKQAYDKAHAGNTLYTHLINAYRQTIDEQNKLLNIREGYYQQLKLAFDSVTTGSLAVLERSDTRLQTATSALDKATVHLKETQQLLEDARQKLIEENRKRNAKALKFGLGGIAIGALVTGLIVAL
jgi:hypothetical protein